MLANRFTAMVDACTLVNRMSRHLLLNLSMYDLFRIRWSPKIIEEASATVLDLALQKKGLDEQAVRADISQLFGSLEENFPDALVNIENINLPTLPEIDAKDQHVAQAAICCNASVIVTENVKDFPSDCLEPFDIEIKSGDEFICDTIDLDYTKSMPAIKAMRERFKNPPLNPDQLITELERYELFDTASLLAQNSTQI